MPAIVCNCDLVGLMALQMGGRFAGGGGVHSMLFIAKVVAVRGKMHAQFRVRCSDCGGRFARGSVLPRLLSSWFSRLLPELFSGFCQDVAKNVAKVIAVRKEYACTVQFGVALGVRVGWSLCAGQRVVLIVFKVVAKRIWIEDTPGRPLEFPMIINIYIYMNANIYIYIYIYIYCQ